MNDRIYQSDNNSDNNLTNQKTTMCGYLSVPADVSAEVPVVVSVVVSVVVPVIISARGYVWVSAAGYNGYRGGLGAVEINGIEPETQLRCIN